MAEQAGHGNGQGGAPRRDPGLPDGPASAPGADPRLAGFAKGGEWDACPPSAALAAALEAASGPGWRCPGASREEMLGLLRQWQALESRAAAAKLGVLRALIRDDDQPLPGGGYHGDLPDGVDQVADPRGRAGPVDAGRVGGAADVAGVGPGGRLPGTGGLLAAGELTYSKAQAVDEALQPLSGQDAAAGGGDDPARAARQDLRASRQARRPGGDHRRPGVRNPAPRGRRAEQVPGGDVPRGVRRGGPVRPGTAHRPGPRRPRQRLRPRRRNTRNPARSPTTPGWTSTAPRLTSTCSTASPPRRGSPPACCPAPARRGAGAAGPGGGLRLPRVRRQLPAARRAGRGRPGDSDPGDGAPGSEGRPTAGAGPGDGDSGDPDDSDRTG